MKPSIPRLEYILAISTLAGALTALACAENRGNAGHADDNRTEMSVTNGTSPGGTPGSGASVSGDGEDYGIFDTGSIFDPAPMGLSSDTGLGGIGDMGPGGTGAGGAGDSLFPPDTAILPDRDPTGSIPGDTGLGGSGGFPDQDTAWMDTVGAGVDTAEVPYNW